MSNADEELAALRAVAEAAYDVAWELDPNESERVLKYGDNKHAWLRQTLNKWHRVKQASQSNSETKEG